MRQNRFYSYIGFFLLSVFPKEVSSQVYSYFQDSIAVIADTNYQESKNKLLEIEKIGFKIYPSDKLFFLGYSLENNDIKYFKDNAKILMRDYGWHYSYSDTLPEKIRLFWLKGIHDLNITDWTVRTCEKNYPIWTKNNIEAVDVQKQLVAYKYFDQTLRKKGGSFYNSLGDSLRIRFFAKYDQANFQSFVDLCKQNNTMLNEYDHGIGAYSIGMFILWHALKDNQSKFEYNWSLILPYLEKAYFDNKIPNTFLFYYDYASKNNFGYQYYGTLGKYVPVKEPETLQERRKKFEL